LGGLKKQEVELLHAPLSVIDPVGLSSPLLYKEFIRTEDSLGGLKKQEVELLHASSVSCTPTPTNSKIYTAV